MSDAVKMIVDGYVSLKNHEPLEQLREHRLRLRRELQAKSSPAFDISGSMQVVDNDLQAIEAGFARL